MKVKKEAVAYYKRFLQLVPSDFETITVEFIEELVDYRCSAEEASSLVQQVTDKEITKILFSMPKEKAPGPDGYRVEFYKAAWPVVRRDFIVVVHSFFLNGFMPKSTNATNTGCTKNA